MINNRRNKNVVTIKDVSNHAGVSIKTVSRVINNEENVAETTKSKVLASVEKLVSSLKSAKA